MVGQPPNN